MKTVILAGGGGTRLWPLSTEEKPKQFQKLVSGKTMLEETLSRLDFLNPQDIYLAINKKHLKLTKKLCPNIPPKNILIEPALRDTASCIGYAASLINKNHPDSVMAVIYADHIIKNKKEFKKKLKLAEKKAGEGFLTVIEVTAKEPNTNYGYVKIGAKIGQDIFRLDSFTEKPDHKTAEKFVKSGKYLWNTGIYVWKTGKILEKYKKHQPKTYQIFQEILKSGSTKNYKNLSKISIDYAIMEKVNPKEVLIIKANLGWSDIGTWEAIHKEFAKSSAKNITRGPVKLLDCRGCLIYADNQKEIRAVSLRDTVVIDAPEGQLICPLKASKRVKEIK